ncbi:MAG TPA: carboxypeptidase regulatory-like domain-containing protein [Thermoanaerobaculia bacterium]
MFALLTLLVEASRLFVPPGTLPKESRVESVQIETGWFETRLIGEGDVPDFKSPAGTLVVSVFGPNGASRGFMRLAVKRGEEIAIQVPTSPARGRGQLSLELAFPRDAKPDPKDVSLLLVGHEKRLFPDVFVFTGTARARAFWLDVPAGAAAIALTSREWTLAKPLNPDVPERGALVVRGELVPKPSLRLRFDVAESVGHGTVEVDLLDCEKQRNFPGPTPIERCTPVSSQKGRSDAEFVFKNLDPKLFAVRWKLGKWTDTTTEDLENARPTVKTIPIRPFEVSGRVTAGGLPAFAKLRFWPVNTALSFETDADEDGFYRIALVRRGSFLVWIRRPGFEPFQADLRLEGDDPRDEHADFDVPVNRVTVRIFAAKTGEPIAGATAFVEGGGGFSGTTDASGAAVLSPLPKNSYTITGSAKGYRSSEPVRLDVDEGTREREIRIGLLLSADIRLRVLDIGGVRLVGASVCAMSGPDPISDGRTDDNGIAVLPNPFPPGQPLVAWDAAGHIGVYRWSGEEQQDLVIPLSAPPILVRFVSAGGEPRPRWAPGFSIDGVEVPLYIARFEKSGGDTVSRPDGTFRLAGIPSSGLLVLWPFGIPELSMTRPLPVVEEIVFTVPAR